jgi:hypothetical protein
MTIDPWIVAGLAAFDVLIVALVLLLLAQLVMNRRDRVVIAIGFSGFVFHAFLFFSGVILCLQLATLAVIYFALVFWPSRQQTVDGPRDRT